MLEARIAAAIEDAAVEIVAVLFDTVELFRVNWPMLNTPPTAEAVLFLTVEWFRVN